MKAIKFLIAALVMSTKLAPTAEAQTIQLAPGVPVYSSNFYRDSVSTNSGFAADSIFVSMQAPFKCNIVKFEVYMSSIDTGSAASVRKVELKKNNGTVLSTLTFTSTAANVYTYDLTSFPYRLNASDVVRAIWTCGTGFRFRQVMVRIWYTRV